MNKWFLLLVVFFLAACGAAAEQPPAPTVYAYSLAGILPEEAHNIYNFFSRPCGAEEEDFECELAVRADEPFSVNEVFGPYSQENGYKPAGQYGLSGWAASNAATALVLALKNAGAEVQADWVDPKMNLFLPAGITPTEEMYNLYQVVQGRDFDTDIKIVSPEKLVLHLKGSSGEMIQIWVTR